MEYNENTMERDGKNFSRKLHKVSPSQLAHDEETRGALRDFRRLGLEGFRQAYGYDVPLTPVASMSALSSAAPSTGVPEGSTVRQGAALPHEHVIFPPPVSPRNGIEKIGLARLTDLAWRFSRALIGRK